MEVAINSSRICRSDVITAHWMKTLVVAFGTLAHGSGSQNYQKCCTICSSPHQLYEHVLNLPHISFMQLSPFRISPFMISLSLWPVTLSLPLHPVSWPRVKGQVTWIKVTNHSTSASSLSILLVVSLDHRSRCPRWPMPHPLPQAGGGGRGSRRSDPACLPLTPTTYSISGRLGCVSYLLTTRWHDTWHAGPGLTHETRADTHWQSTHTQTDTQTLTHTIGERCNWRCGD